MQKGWKYRSDWHCWWKKHDHNGMRWRPWRKWIDVEVSLPRILNPDSSSMTYDPWTARTAIMDQLDAAIELDLPNSVFQSPDWNDWCVSRADITADFTFKQEAEVDHIIKTLPTARMTHRREPWMQPGEDPTSFKWASKANKVACSTNDKFKESGRDVDRGKLRMTVIYNERRNKPHLRKHHMQRVRGLFNGDEGKFLEVLVGEVKRIRPKHKVRKLRFLEEQAAKAYHHGAC